jgi:hypothetical protein
MVCVKNITFLSEEFFRLGHKSRSVCWKSSDVSEEYFATFFDSEAGSKQSLLNAGFLFGLFYDPEDGR